MNNLFINDFEFIHTYMYDLLILSKVDWIYHVQRLLLMFNKMKKRGLKCNTEKSFFEQIRMEYLD